jgi:hypothetical protein
MSQSVFLLAAGSLRIAAAFLVCVPAAWMGFACWGAGTAVSIRFGSRRRRRGASEKRGERINGKLGRRFPSFLGFGRRIGDGGEREGRNG